MSPSTTPRAADARPNLYGRDRDGLFRLLAEHTDKRFHVDQVYHWLYGRNVDDFDAMSDLPATLRRSFAGAFRIARPVMRPVGRSEDGSIKYLVGLHDGAEAEAVSMVQGERHTLCLSTQVGCPLACSFCLTGTMGLVRNLKPGEIVAQVAALAADRGLPPAGLRVVFMGMGEPLNNYDAVMAAFRIMVDPRGFGMAPRRITLSTAGLVPGITKLGRESPRPRLAISLAAADDPLRSRLMPVNRKWNLATLIDACRAFPLAPREKITFEYALMLGVNDSERQAAAVARRLRGVRAKVNVIPYNEAGLGGFRTPPAAVAGRFRDLLLQHGVPASIRWSKGRDIGAACGQLARGDRAPVAPPALSPAKSPADEQA